MKQLTKYLMLASLAIISLLSFKPTVDIYKIDLKQSSMNWTGYKVTGKHTGAILLKSGEVSFEGSKLVGGMFEIDMTSITDTDMSGEYADKLVNHLKSPDFFNTRKSAAS